MENYGSIPERDPEKRLTHPRNAAGASIIRSWHREAMSIYNNAGLSRLALGMRTMKIPYRGSIGGQVAIILFIILDQSIIPQVS
jgi:hypothetical protein